MIDQTHVVNSVREACGYVSLNWKGDIETCKYVKKKRKKGKKLYGLTDNTEQTQERTQLFKNMSYLIFQPIQLHVLAISDPDPMLLHQSRQTVQGR